MGVAASPIARARTDHGPALAVGAVVVTGATLAVSGSVVMIATGHGAGWLSSSSALLVVLALGWGAAALSIARHEPRNRAAWALSVSALAGLAVACTAAVSLLTGSEPVLAGNVGDVPADVAAPVAWLRSIALTASTAAVLVPLTFGFLLFPDGAFPSRGWRTAGVLAGLVAGGQCLAWLAALQPGHGADLLDSPVLRIVVLTSSLTVLVGIAAVVCGLRTGPGVVRQQFKWVAWGAGVCAIACAAGIAMASVMGGEIATPLVASGVVVLTAAYTVAIRRSWLHEIDPIISYSLVYAALAAFVVLVSVGSLVIASHLFGDGGDPNLVVAIVATTGIAAGFRPLRGHLRARVERAVFGRTATPHRVLSEFSRRVAANGEDPLSIVARSLVEGTGAIRAQVWLDTGGHRIKAAEWPAGVPMAVDQESRFVIAHGDTTLGALVLEVPVGGRLSFEDCDLAEQVASGMGLALQNGILASTLDQRILQLRASRRRLIALQDETRRRLERDLHDGAQQQLVALRVKLGVARLMADRDGATVTGAAIDELAKLVQAAIDALRELARGVYPPLLEAEGLAASIAAEARRAPFSTTLRLDGLGRYHRDVEGTVYLCVVEGLRQAAQARAARGVTVRVAEAGGRLSFEVRLEGSPRDAPRRGMTSAPAARLAALADRVDTLSGRLSIGDSPDTPGVILAGETPIGEEVAS
jgi:signal transduction histidine kinase